MILRFLIWFFIFCTTTSVYSATTCGDWLPYKDEKCFKILDNTLRTFDEAVQSCKLLNTGELLLGNTPTLPVITSADEQLVLADYLFKAHSNVDNFWIGAKYSSVDKHYKWIDSSEWNYTNWDTKGPRNGANYCVEMESDSTVMGKWYDMPCEKRNLVVCQRVQPWSLVRIQEALLEERKKREELQQSLWMEKQEARKQIGELQSAFKAHEQEWQNKLEQVNKKLLDLSHNQVPLGFVYAQLPKERSPSEIWPSMKWQDVSAAYAGVFFRVSGGNAAAFGQVQSENVPRVLKAEKTLTGSQVSDEGNPIDMVANAWSKHIWVGGDSGEFIYWRFFTGGGEVRPVNMAIRVWKRVG